MGVNGLADRGGPSPGTGATLASVNRVQVNCTPQQAFDLVADISTHCLWSPDDIRVEKVSPEPVGVGSRFRTTGYSLVAQRDSSADIEVTCFEPPRRFAFVAHSGGRSFENVFIFTSVSQGTLVERTLAFAAIPEMSSRLEALGAVLEQRREQSLSMLKELLENRAG